MTAEPLQVITPTEYLLSNYSVKIKTVGSLIPSRSLQHGFFDTCCERSSAAAFPSVRHK